MGESRVEDQLENLTGSASELEPPKSRVEEILQAMIDGTEVPENDKSRVEVLLAELAKQGGGGGGGARLETGVTVSGASRYQITRMPDEGYDGLANVTILPTTETKQITENGTYDVLNFADAVVNVPSGGVDITDGIVVKARDANGRATSIDFYGETVNIKQFCNRTDSDGAWIALATVILKDTVRVIKEYAFYSCSSLSNIDFSNIETINFNSFANCIGLISVSLPRLTKIGQNSFAGCTGLKALYAPVLTSLENRAFRGCTSLKTVQLGSVGHGVNTFSGIAFELDKQSGLTITIYTTGSYADTLVGNIRAYATNATIIIKASEATTYNGTSYAAGETILTSEVAA